MNLKTQFQKEGQENEGAIANQVLPALLLQSIGKILFALEEDIGLTVRELIVQIKPATR